MRAARARPQCNPLSEPIQPTGKETTMFSLETDRCQCSNCPGAGCQCGCQAATAELQQNAAGTACNCGHACGCDAAEQGCLCPR
jgi:hypothetical protein